MKLSSDLLKSLTAYTANLKGDIKIVLQKGDHEKRDELRTFLSDVCSVSKKLYLEDLDLGSRHRSPLSFTLFLNEVDDFLFFTDGL